MQPHGLCVWFCNRARELSKLDVLFNRGRKRRLESLEGSTESQVSTDGSASSLIDADSECSHSDDAIAQSIYVMRKVRIRTIPGFCCANLGSELCAIILGSRTQTSDPRICCANLKSARNLLGSRNQTSAIRGNKPTIDRARKAARHTRQRSHDRSRTQSS